MNNKVGLPSEEDIKFYETNGYWISPKLFDDTTLENLLHHMDLLYRGEYETGIPPRSVHWKYGDDPQKLRMSTNIHISDRAMYELVTNPILGAIAASLLGTEQVRLFTSEMFYKPARGSGTNLGNVGWHQDFHYWKFTESPTLLTAWVAFNDVSLENGCVQMAPGSHKWGLQSQEDSFFEQELEKQEVSMKEKLEFKAVPIELKAGQVSFHHALTYHGSGRNISDRPRCSMAIHLMAGETRFKAGHEEWEKHKYIRSFHNLNDGDPITGEDFPLIYESNRP